VIQWREKDLSRDQNRRYVVQGVQLAQETGKKFLLNSDIELALEEQADGVHLTADQELEIAYRLRAESTVGEFLLGKSVHSIEDCVSAASGGADYLLLAPIFDPISKQSHANALGLRALQASVAAVSIPVLALGGISVSNFALVVSSGAAGVAGISWINDEVRQKIAQR
jgi:thiamine-phosphate diphosphorylase